MKTLKVIYNNQTTFIVDIAEKFKDFFHLELFNYDSKQKKKTKLLMEDFGTMNFPLIIIQDENLETVSAIWSESSPNWEDEIDEILKND